MKVAGIGAGPSGLMAAWAVVALGHSVELYDASPNAIHRWDKDMLTHSVSYDILENLK